MSKVLLDEAVINRNISKPGQYLDISNLSNWFRCNLLDGANRNTPSHLPASRRTSQKYVSDHWDPPWFLAFCKLYVFQCGCFKLAKVIRLGYFCKSIHILFPWTNHRALWLLLNSIAVSHLHISNKQKTIWWWHKLACLTLPSFTLIYAQVWNLKEYKGSQVTWATFRNFDSV